MKIIHLVLGKANPNRMNGVNKVANQLASTQKDLKQDVELWGIANNLTHDYPKRNYTTYLFQQLKNKLVLDKHLVQAIKSLPQDAIFHFHGAFIPEFFKVAKLLKNQKIPFVYTPHGSFAEAALQQSKWTKKVYIQLFESFILKNAKAVQLLGTNEFNHLDNVIKIEHKHLIANGQNLNEIPNVSNFNTKNELPLFGFCGRLDKNHKGLDLLLDGFKLYLDNHRKGYLSLIGDGKDRVFLEQKAKNLNIENYVVFHGKKFGNEKFDLLSQMDVFMHTSRMEGFPTAVLEAAALQKPCITSNETNINNYISKYEAGFPLAENNPIHICEAMENAADSFYDKKLKIKGKNALRMVKNEFSWPKIAKQLIEIYKF